MFCDEQPQSLALFGRLYNWYAVVDARELCPLVGGTSQWMKNGLNFEDYITSQGFAYRRGRH